MEGNVSEVLFTCDRGAFLNAFRAATSMVNGESDILIERYVFVEVALDGTITMRAQKYGQGQLKIAVPAKVEHADTFGLPKEGALLRLQAMSGSDLTFVRVSDSEIGVRSEGVKTTVPQMPVTNYPPDSAEQLHLVAHIKTPGLARAFRLAYITSHPSTGNITHALLLALRTSDLTITGASPLLGITTTTLALEHPFEGDDRTFLIPRSTIEPFIALSRGDTFDLFTDEAGNQFGLGWSNILTSGVLWGGEYPSRALDLARTVQPMTIASISVNEFTSILSLLKGMRSDRKSLTCAMLSFGLNALRVRAPKYGYDGRAEADIACERTGPWCKVGINADEMRLILNEVSGETVTLGVSENGIMLVLNEDFTHLASSIGGTFDKEQPADESAAANTSTVGA